jgi:hypothetical protein
LITRIIFGDEYWPLSSLLCSLLHSPVASSLVDPNILLGTLFPNTLSLFSSRSVRDQVSHPYKTTGKTTVLYALIFLFMGSLICTIIDGVYLHDSHIKVCVIFVLLIYLPRVCWWHIESFKPKHVAQIR